MDRVDSYSDLVDEHGNMTFGFPREDRNIPPGSPGFHSDLEYPEWQTDVPGEPPLVDENGHMTFGAQARGHPGLRTNSGILDLLHHLTEVFEYQGEDRDSIDERLRKVLEPPPRRVWTFADVLPSLAFHTDTFVLPPAPGNAAGAATLLTARSDRTRVIVANQGANPAYLSFSDDMSNLNTAGETAWIALPAPAAGIFTSVREFKCGGKIYAWSPAGTSVDIQEEYGFRRWEDGRLSA